ncbi:hypothetical protein NN561_011559 [Cricetulus griseus]
MTFITPAFVQLSWEMPAVTASQKRNKFACSWVVRALWLQKRPDNSVKSPADRAAPDCTRSSLGAADSKKHRSQHGIKGLGISQVKILKAQRSLHLAKKVPLKREACRKKE